MVPQAGWEESEDELSGQLANVERQLKTYAAKRNTGMRMATAAGGHPCLSLVPARRCRLPDFQLHLLTGPVLSSSLSGSTQRFSSRIAFRFYSEARLQCRPSA